MFELHLLTQERSVFYIVDSYNETLRVDHRDYLVESTVVFQTTDLWVAWQPLAVCRLRLQSLLGWLKRTRRRWLPPPSHLNCTAERGGLGSDSSDLAFRFQWQEPLSNGFLFTLVTYFYFNLLYYKN